MTDWFEGLAECLHWNQRKKQLPLGTDNPKVLKRERSQLHQSFANISESLESPTFDSAKTDEVFK